MGDKRIDKARELIRSVEVGKDFLGPARAQLEALLWGHPETTQEWLDSVKSFRHTMDFQGNDILTAYFHDGSKTPVSWRRAASKPSPVRLHRSRVNQAMRWEVGWQVARLRQPGEHVHHDEVPFQRILEEFLATEGLTLDRIEVADMPDAPNGGCRVLKDRALAKRWHDYHRNRAKLISLSKDEHMAAHHQTA